MEEVRQSLRRLVRRTRQATPQGLHLKPRRQATQREDEACSSSKKSPALGDCAAILAKWAAQWPNHHAYNQTARSAAAEIGKLQPHQLNEFIAAAILQKWKTRYEPTTYFNRRNILQRILGMLTAYGAPPMKIQKARKPEARGVTATDRQIEKLLAAARPPMRLFILLCWQMALRFSEAFAVTPLTWDAAQKTIFIPVKGRKHRRLPVTPEIEQLLNIAAQSAGDPSESCISLLNGSHISPKVIRNQWWQLTKQIGDPAIRPHDLRRTTATNLYRLTHDIRAVQQYLGHSNLVSTTHYLAPLAEEQLRELHALLNFKSETKQ